VLAIHLHHLSLLSHLTHTLVMVILTCMKNRHLLCYCCYIVSHLFSVHCCFSSLSCRSLLSISSSYYYRHCLHSLCSTCLYCSRFRHKIMPRSMDLLYLIHSPYCLYLTLLITFLVMVTHLVRGHSFSCVIFSFYCLVFVVFCLFFLIRFHYCWEYL